MGRKLLLFFFFVAGLIVGFLGYVQCYYSASLFEPEREIKREVIKQKRHANKRECYDQCFKETSKDIEQRAPHCLVKTSEIKEKWDSRCITRFLYAISYTCRAHCWSEYGP